MSIAEHVQRAIALDPTGQHFLSPLLSCFPEAHWGAVRAPGALRVDASGALSREVPLPASFADWAEAHPEELAAPLSPADRAVHLACCLETDTFVLALEDAIEAPLEAGTAAYPARHRLSRVIEAVRAIADGRLYAVGVIAGEGYVEPRRGTILEGLPHIEREEAEDLYASYWGWCTPARLARALDVG